MASRTLLVSLVLISHLITFLLVLDLPRACNAQLAACKFDGIYQLGDSLSDTGNFIREKAGSRSVFGRLPYGETTFKNATGRCSNGFLVIDYIAQSAGIPLLDAYLNDQALFVRGRGVNFAVAGSTALPVYVLAEKKISAPITNSSLDEQLDWMFSFFNAICLTPDDCLEKLKSALFFVGEIGAGDYSYALIQGKRMEEVTALVPDVVKAIHDAITKVISFGARRVVVPGLIPLGCLPIYLTQFQSKDASAYDEFHCLKAINDLSVHHNLQLQQVIEVSRKENPNITIVYGDYYNAYISLLRQAPSLGFDSKNLLKACCGAGGDYDFTLNGMCGARGVPVCPQPDQRINWDGVHLTQKAYQQIASRLINDVFPKLQCK